MTSLDLTDQTLLKQTTKTSLSGSSRGPDCGSEERGLHPPAGEQPSETGTVIWWWGCWCDVCLYSWWSWPQTAVWMATLWTREAWWPRPRPTSWWWRATDITSMVEVSTESHSLWGRWAVCWNIPRSYSHHVTLQLQCLLLAKLKKVSSNRSPSDDMHDWQYFHIPQS